MVVRLVNGMVRSPAISFSFSWINPLVTRQQIFEHFWPKLKVKDATNVFHVTKRKITERITACIEKDDDSYELTKYSAGFYMPSEKIVRHYDVDDFTEAVEQAMISEDEHTRELLYKRAIDIYRGPFLSTIDMPWVLKRREELAQMVCRRPCWAWLACLTSVSVMMWHSATIRAV